MVLMSGVAWCIPTPCMRGVRNKNLHLQFMA